MGNLVIDVGSGQLLARRFAFLFLALSLLSALPPTAAASSHPAPASPGTEAPFLRGAHWFGSGWVINFWNTALLERAAADFAALREDGFNTVVLVVPWPGFATDPGATDLDPERARRLGALIDLADEAGLEVVLRIGYAWDSSVDGSARWLLRVWSEPEAYRGWLAHFAALWDLVRDRPRVRFAFFSWEGLWVVVSHGRPELVEERRDAAQRIGYQDWLAAHYDLAAISERYGVGFDAWDAVPVPTRMEPAYDLFLEFIDHALVERFFKPAQARFPRLTMEVRIDADPVWNAPGDLAYWYSHEQAWDLPGAPWTAVYWAPAMGADNDQASIAPARAAELLEYQLDRVRMVTGNRPIFISQFLVEDFTPGYEGNTRLARDEVGSFLELAEPVLAGHAHGYALWAWRDYLHDAVASPDFFRPEIAWQGVRPDHEPGPYPLAAGERLQHRFQRYEFHPSAGPERADLCLTAITDDDPAPDLRVSAEPQGVTVELDLSTGEQGCVDIPLLPATDITLEALRPLQLTKATFSGFLQPSGIRDRQGQPKPVASAWRSLNTRLDHPRPAPFDAFDDGWMGKTLSREIEWPEGEGSRVLTLRTYLPPNWPFEPQLRVTRAGQELGTVSCAAGGAYRIPLPSATGDGRGRLEVTVDRTWRPPGDGRFLGCLLLEMSIAAGP